jgi:hypothetical protein
MDSMKPARADFASAINGLNHLYSSSFKAQRCKQ